jgi:hypothetical protein
MLGAPKYTVNSFVKKFLSTNFFRRQCMLQCLWWPEPAGFLASGLMYIMLLENSQNSKIHA